MWPSPSLLRFTLLGLLSVFIMTTESYGQAPNYDESKIPDYKLPDILKFEDGSPVANAKDWVKRRQEILHLFSLHVYGSMPSAEGVHLAPQPMSEFSLEWAADVAGPVQARAKEVVLRITRNGNSVSVRLLIVLPKNDESASQPVFLAYNFDGNHSIHSTEEIHLGKVWEVDPANRTQRIEKPAVPDDRGKRASRWPLEDIIAQGFGLVTLYYGDVDPDFDDGFENGIHRLFPEQRAATDNWSSIAAWGWTLHRVMDYFEGVEEIDHQRVAVLGHSRLGKTALWAGATDERISLVISNNSGCGGAALARRKIGETVARINTVFPHWFCQKHKEYNHRESELPVDQHMLLASIAPRALYVASAKEDRWADPRGEYLSIHHAAVAWERLGATNTFRASAEPVVDQPLMDQNLGYHVRSGKHDINRYDWEQYLRFAKQVLARSGD